MSYPVKISRLAADKIMPSGYTYFANQVKQGFVTDLQSAGLIIVRAKDVQYDREVALEQMRRKLLKKDWLTYTEILKMELLPVTSKQGLQKWVDNGTFLKGEVNKDGRGTKRILTSALKRLGYIQ